LTELNGSSLNAYAFQYYMCWVGVRVRLIEREAPGKVVTARPPKRFSATA